MKKNGKNYDQKNNFYFQKFLLVEIVSNHFNVFFNSSTLKSGKNLSEKNNSAYHICHNIKPDNLLAKFHLVLITKSKSACFQVSK
jgi:hypothetical protein